MLLFVGTSFICSGSKYETLYSEMTAWTSRPWKIATMCWRTTLTTSMRQPTKSSWSSRNSSTATLTASLGRARSSTASTTSWLRKPANKGIGGSSESCFLLSFFFIIYQHLFSVKNIKGTHYV